MIVRWKVIYTFRNRVLVSGTVPNYPQLGVVIRCVEGAIACIEHELSTDEQAAHDEVLAASQRDLSLLMEWLAYEYGVPIQVQTRTTERIADDPTVPALKADSIALDLKIELVRSVTLPSEMTLLGAPLRLQSQLRYANDARDSKTAEEAVRLYYVILEDLFGKPEKGKWPMDALKIKYCRDFTSHGDKLKNVDLLAYLE